VTAGFGASDWHIAFHAVSLLLYPEDGGNMFLQNYVPDYQIKKHKIPADYNHTVISLPLSEYTKLISAIERPNLSK
jgi:hypothetical protein